MNKTEELKRMNEELQALLDYMNSLPDEERIKFSIRLLEMYKEVKKNRGQS